VTGTESGSGTVGIVTVSTAPNSVPQNRSPFFTSPPVADAQTRRLLRSTSEKHALPDMSYVSVEIARTSWYANIQKCRLDIKYWRS
jgi:hypothetical protein